MNPSLRLMVIGSSGHAQSVLEAADSSGFVVDGTISTANSDGDIGFASLLSALHDIDLVTTALAFGHGVNHVRFRAFEEVLSVFPQAQFPPIIHSSAWVSPTASLGRGAVVLSQASVGSGSTLGVGALINTGASLDHDSTMNDFASLGPGARTGGNASIGMRTMVGLQSGILQGRSVGDDTVIGAHSLVTEDIPSLVVAMGTPALVTRTRERGESHY